MRVCVAENLLNFSLKNDFFDYEALLMAENNPEDDHGDINLAKSLKKIRAKYKVLGHTFATDAM